MDCATCQPLLAEFALGQLADEERRGVSAHLAAGCPHCGRVLREAEETWVLLVDPLPPAIVPNRITLALHERLLHQSQIERPVKANGTPLGATIVARNPNSTASQRWPRRSVSRPAKWIVAATVLLAVTIGLAAWSSKDRPVDLPEQAAVREQIEQLRGELERAGQLFGGDRLRFASLHEKDQLSTLHGQIIWDRLSRQIHLYAFDLPPLASGRAYRIWIVGNKADPALVGVLIPKENGTASALVDVPRDIGEAFRIGVTDEPADLPPAPTAEPWLTSEVQ